VIAIIEQGQYSETEVKFVEVDDKSVARALIDIYGGEKCDDLVLLAVAEGVEIVCEWSSVIHASDFMRDRRTTSLSWLASNGTPTVRAAAELLRDRGYSAYGRPI